MPKPRKLVKTLKQMEDLKLKDLPDKHIFRERFRKSGPDECLDLCPEFPDCECGLLATDEVF